MTLDRARRRALVGVGAGAGGTALARLAQVSGLAAGAIGLAGAGRSALAQSQAQPSALPAGEPIRLAMIEGFSGAFANAGDSVWRNVLYAVERINRRGGVRVAGRARPLQLERFDSKGQTEEALVMLRRVTDQRIPFVLQGNSSAVAAAILEAVNRHNDREPGNRLLFLNYSAGDPALTNERCSFWHFRFDAHAEMRMSALTDAMAGNRDLRRVYLLNQDYSFGRQVSELARRMITEKRPDIRIVGEELHPLGRIKDFVPYAAKIKAAGADTVVTANWGNDLTLLVRAAREVGLAADFYTFYANGLGAPAAIGEAGVDRVRAVAEWHPNAGLPAGERILAEFRAQLKDPREDYFNMRHVLMLEMLASSIEAAGGSDAVAVARALEGRTQRDSPYTATMRAEDHQLLTPMYVSVMQRAGPRAGNDLKHDLEGSGFGFRTERFIEAERSALPHACKMERPAR